MAPLRMQTYTNCKLVIFKKEFGRQHLVVTFNTLRTLILQRSSGQHASQTTGGQRLCRNQWIEVLVSTSYLSTRGIYEFTKLKTV